MMCNKCGIWLEENSQYCPNCGSKVENIEQNENNIIPDSMNTNTKVFLYNDDLFKKVEKENRNDLLKKTLIFLLIEVICIICSMIPSSSFENNDIVMYVVAAAMVLSTIIFFPCFYYLMIFFSDILGNKHIFSDRCYTIINNKFFSLKFVRDFNLVNFGTSNVLLSLIGSAYNLLSMNSDDNSIKDKISAGDFNLSDLYSYIEIINVYEIKEYKNRYEIKCDYIEKIGNKNYKKEILTIYKYFDNYTEIYDFLNNMKNNSKI